MDKPDHSPTVEIKKFSTEFHRKICGLQKRNFQESRSEGAVIRATEFHPSSTVGLVAGLNGTASLFHVDGKTNPKIQTVNVQNFPIECARFSADGREFLVGSQHHPHLFVYDMMAGKIGKVHWNRAGEGGATNSQAFEVSPDGQLLAVCGRAGTIHLLSARYTASDTGTITLSPAVK